MTATQLQRLSRVMLVAAASLVFTGVTPLAQAAPVDTPAGSTPVPGDTLSAAVDGNEGGIYARRYHADGTPYGSEILVSPTGNVNRPPQFAILRGNFVIQQDGGPQETLPIVVPCSSLKTGPAGESGQAITSIKVVDYTNPELFTAGPTLAGCDTPLSATPAPGASGHSIVTLAVTDDGGTAGGGDDTETLTLDLRIQAPPSGRSTTVSGKENSGCIPVSLIGSVAHNNLWMSSSDPRFPGLVTDYPPFGFLIDGDSFSTVTGNGRLTYENKDGTRVQILPGQTYFLSPIEKTLCLIPSADEHSVYDTATKQFKPYATFEYRVRDGYGGTTAAYTVSFIVEDVF